MLVQLIFSMIFICILVVIACIAGMAAAALNNGRAGIPAYVYAFFCENLPLDSLHALVLRITFAVFCSAVFFRHVSNHIIISMDILYFESLVLLFLCRSTKSCRGPLAESQV